MDNVFIQLIRGLLVLNDIRIRRDVFIFLFKQTLINNSTRKGFANIFPFNYLKFKRMGIILIISISQYL